MISLKVGDRILRLDPPQLFGPDGEFVPLRAQSIAVLACLAESPNTPVARRAIEERVWNGTCVTEASLTKCIGDIRRALGDADRSIVCTEHRRGYRLVAERIGPGVPNGAPASTGVPAFPSPDDEIRFTESEPGIRLAYATIGAGPTVLRAPHWMTHVGWDLRNGIYRHTLETLASALSVLRYDARGLGLSSRACGVGGLEEWVADMSAVIGASGVGRLALLGVSGGSLSAIRFAVRFPERVSSLVLLGGFTQGGLHRGMSRSHVRAFARLIADGWSRDNAAFRQLMTSQLYPGASAEQMAAFNEIQQVSSDSATAAELMTRIAETTVLDDLSRVRAPTLVIHSRNDARQPFEQALLMASRIPDATLVALDTPNHTPLPDEPEFGTTMARIIEFVAHHGRGDVTVRRTRAATPSRPSRGSTQPK